jgi:hypothetical protein
MRKSEKTSDDRANADRHFSEHRHSRRRCDLEPQWIVGTGSQSLRGLAILALSATAGFEASAFGSWLATASNFWQ